MLVLRLRLRLCQKSSSVKRQNVSARYKPPCLRRLCSSVKVLALALAIALVLTSLVWSRLNETSRVCDIFMNFCVVSREIREIDKRGVKIICGGSPKIMKYINALPPFIFNLRVHVSLARSLLLHKKGCYRALQCFCAACNDCHACTRKSSNQNIARLATKGVLHASMLKNVAATVAKVTTSAGN